MSHMASGILGTVAAVLALGAVHLEVAAGNDLLGPAIRGDASLGVADPGSATQLAVNRTAKADRQSVPQRADGVTISFRIPGMAGTSVAMRVPAGTSQVDKPAPQPTAARAASPPRLQIACETPVSPLTAVAKQLQAGRCIT